MNIWPTSYFPAGISREKDWNASDQMYDSGDALGLTPWSKPLYRYTAPFKNVTEVKHDLIWDFWDQQRSTVIPFLMKDPYDYRVNSVLAVASGPTTGSLYLYDTNSFSIRADTTTIGSLFSSKSGYVNLGTNFSYDQDSGVFNITTKDADDIWGVRSLQYFKKAKFTGSNREESPLWNIFNFSLQIRELP